MLTDRYSFNLSRRSRCISNLYGSQEEWLNWKLKASGPITHFAPLKVEQNPGAMNECMNKLTQFWSWCSAQFRCTFPLTEKRSSIAIFKLETGQFGHWIIHTGRNQNNTCINKITDTYLPYTLWMYVVPCKSIYQESVGLAFGKKKLQDTLRRYARHKNLSTSADLEAGTISAWWNPSISWTTVTLPKNLRKTTYCQWRNVQLPSFSYWKYADLHNVKPSLWIFNRLKVRRIGD